MLTNFEDIWFLTVSELQARHKISSEKYGRLQSQFLRIESASLEKKEKLAQMNTEIAVTSRNITDNKNYIFGVNKKLADIHEAMNFVEAGYQKMKTRQIELNHKKQALSFRIKKIQKSIPDSEKQCLGLNERNKITIHKIEALEKEKTNLSADISKFLSQTSTDRDEFEKKTETLNNTFIQNIVERQTSADRLNQIKEKNKGIIADFENAKMQIPNIQEIKDLKKIIPIKELEIQDSGAERTEHQVSLRDKTGALDNLLVEIGDIEMKISLFDDDSILRVEKASSEFDRVKNEFETTVRDREQNLNDIFDLIIEKTGLEENHEMIIQRLDELKEDTSGLIEEEYSNLRKYQE